MKRITSIVLISLMVYLTSCLEMIDQATNQKPESLSKEDYQTITVDNLYKLDVPNYMKEMKSLHEEASLEYANIYKDAYSVVIHENKQEFIDAFIELDEYDSQLSPVENYVIVQKKMFEESIDKFRFQDYELTKINDYPARQIKVSGTIDGINIKYVVAFIEGEDYIYMLMNWTSSERFKKMENTFEYSTGTFKLI